MEALLEKEADVESWNDERMDELSRRMDAGFAGVKEEVNRRFDEGAGRAQRFESKVETEFHRFTDRLDKLFYIQLFFLISLGVALMTDKA
ncbi:MAG TPA: hypothetical protein VFU11_10920 [Solirubrobacterales bacterium]|nr:hypothetical protein [Solirubrobacterales bacterium]